MEYHEHYEIRQLITLVSGEQDWVKVNVYPDLEIAQERLKEYRAKTTDKLGLISLREKIIE